MQNRESFAKPSISINEDESSIDLQSPKFFIPEDYATVEKTEDTLSPPPSPRIDDTDELESSTQLEDLQQLLEIAHRNEEIANQRLAEISENLEASNKALEESQGEFKASKARDSLTIENLKTMVKTLHAKHEAATVSVESFRKRLDQALLNLNTEKLINTNLQINLDDAKQRFEQSEAGLKKIILKQSRMLTNKDNEIAQLKAAIENAKPFQPLRPTLFSAANPQDVHNEIKSYAPKNRR